MISFNRILIAATTGLFLLAAAVSYARADGCQFGSFEAWQTQIAEIDGAVTTQLPDGDVARIIESKGAPPNGKEGVHYTAHLVVKDDMAAIFFFQEGCLINRIGPAPRFLILQLFGQVEADQPFITRPVLMEITPYA